MRVTGIDQIVNPAAPTRERLLAAFRVVTAITEAVRTVGEIPSGHLYAMLCDRITIEDYTAALRTAKKNAGLVSEDSFHMLRWIGPEIAA